MDSPQTVGLKTHLERALERAESEETRYHIRQALQYCTVTSE